MSNVSSNGNGRQSPHVASETEERYITIVGDLMDLVRRKIISRGEAYLLGEIDSLARSRGMGCWATNATLAYDNGVSIRQIQIDISHLMEIGLIVKSPVQKKRDDIEVRTIETRWSRAVAKAIDEVIPPEGGADTARGDEIFCARGRNGLREGAQKIAPIDNRENTDEKRGSSRSAAPPPRSPRDEATPDLLQPTNAVKATWGSRCAALLYKAVSGAHHVISYKQHQWAARFDRMAREVDPEQIDAVLAWYCAAPQVRVIQSADGFCRQFEILAGMCQRSDGSAALRQKDTQPAVTISPEAQEVVDDLKTMGWPKGSADQLPPLVSSSYVAMQNLYDKLNDILARLDRGKVDGIDPTQPAQANVLRTFLERFMADMGQDAESATARWWRDVHKKVAGWRDWSGQLKSYVFSIEHARFKAILREASYSFSHDEDLATLVLREIKRP